MTTIEGHLSREIRGRILKTLKINYPYRTGDKLITDILIDEQYSVTEPEVSVHLSYLEEKGYVSIETVSAPDMGVKRSLVKLTPKGIDLMEGTIQADPGVNLNGI